MMRPWRAFIMPRMTSLLMRKTARRLVSSPHPTRRPSCAWQVVAGDAGIVDQDADRTEALLDLADQRLAGRRVGHVQRHAGPWMPASASALPISAPDSEVAVPTTVAPRRPSSSATARPMPRDAPVTRATWPSSENSCLTSPPQWLVPGSPRHAPSHPRLPWRCAWSCQRAPCRAALDDVAHAAGGHRLHGSIQRTGEYACRTRASRIFSGSS